MKNKDAIWKPIVFAGVIGWSIIISTLLSFSGLWAFYLLIPATLWVWYVSGIVIEKWGGE